jgi:hypothetical protein
MSVLEFQLCHYVNFYFKYLGLDRKKDSSKKTVFK